MLFSDVVNETVRELDDERWARNQVIEALRSAGIYNVVQKVAGVNTRFAKFGILGVTIEPSARREFKGKNAEFMYIKSATTWGSDAASTAP